jgi:Lon protease-like protein
MAAHVRAGPVLVKMASELHRCHYRSSSIAGGVSPWRRAGAAGRLRARSCVAAPPAAFGSREVPRRDPASFRLFASGSGDPGESSDDDGPRDYLAELSWLPPMDPTKEVEEIDAEANPTTMVMPLFPLGSTAYLPHSDHILNIFEPRYRQMYSDILFNGSRRFAVPVSNPETGRLANVAPVFYLEDLKEVSEQTDDAVKYVCSHKVIGRVRINRTLNDKVWSDRTTYLKAVVEPLEDGDDDEDLSTREGSLTDRFTSIIENQTKLQEPVRFTESLTSSLSAERGEDGLWRMAGLWQSLMQNRLGAKESELSDEIQKLLRQYLESQGQDMRSKVSVQFDSLPAEIRAEFTRLQQQYREESAAMVSATIYPFVLLVQCDTHAERLSVFGEMLEEEEKRLRAKVALQALFSGGGDTEDAKGLDEPPMEA